MSEHPSYLALDRHHLAPDAAIALHAESCARCRAHLAGLQPPAAIPAWVGQGQVRERGSAATTPALIGRAQSARRRWMVGASLLAAAALLFWLRPHSEEVREKGGPDVRVHLKRGESVAPWDGRLRLRAGDRLRLQIATAGYRFVSVAAADGTVLYAGAVPPTGSTLLPTSFRVDGADPEETLDVLLAPAPVPAVAHRDSHPPSGAWRRRLTLPTERAP